VVDFIHVTHWPVFNVADILVTVGGLLVVLHGLRRQPALA
jgi:lipoprotein signal peptidase